MLLKIKIIRNMEKIEDNSKLSYKIQGKSIHIIMLKKDYKCYYYTKENHNTSFSNNKQK